MAFRISNAAAIAALDAALDLIDVTAAGTIQIRTGAAPATVETAATGTLLATLTFSATGFGGATDGTGKATASAAAITDDSSADATGTAGYFRFVGGDGTHVAQGDCGTSGAELNLNTLSITTGGTVSISSYVVELAEV